MPQDYVLLKAGPPQVQVTVFQALALVSPVPIVIQRNRWRLCRVEDLDRICQNFNLPRWQVGIDEVFRTQPNHSIQLEHKLPARFLRYRVGFAPAWLHRDLNKPGPVAEVDKDQPSVVPPSVYPPRQGNLLSGMG